MANSVLSCVAAGDVYLKRDEPVQAFRHFAGPIRETDVAFCNLEGPCSDRGEPTIGKYITIGMGPEVVPALAETGFDLVAVANNHAVDFGREAFVDTLERLEAAGLPHIGGGRNLAEAHRPAILKRNGVSLGWLAYATTVPWGYEATAGRPGIASIRVRTMYEPRYQIMGEQPGTPAIVITEIDAGDLALVVEEVRRLKAETDAVVVSFHWGVAFVPDPAGYQPELAHAAIDAGAAMVLGHHAHVLQGVEMYRGAPIFYSLSNFVFDRNNPRFGLETLLVTARFRRAGLERVAIRPAILPLCGDPRPVTADEGELFQAQLERLSAGMHSSFERDGDELIVTASSDDADA
ncbi:MAG: CapA family protein [Ardenticatenaceae bacterium]|nr:CapA family protein [Ardenticatenaceae bacterium]